MESYSCFVCLPLFSIILRSFILCLSIVHSFFIAKRYVIVWIYSSLFVHSPMDRHFRCFQLLAIKINPLWAWTSLAVDMWFHFSQQSEWWKCHFSHPECTLLTVTFNPFSCGFPLDFDHIFMHLQWSLTSSILARELLQISGILYVCCSLFFGILSYEVGFLWSPQILSSISLSQESTRFYQVVSLCSTAWKRSPGS